MKAIELKLQDMIKERYGSVLAFSQCIGMPNSTVSGVLKNGVDHAAAKNVLRICDALDISADALADGKIVPIYARTPGAVKAETVIAEAVARLLDNEVVTFEETPLTDTERRMLAYSVELSLMMIKRGRS